MYGNGGSAWSPLLRSLLVIGAVCRGLFAAAADPVGLDVLRATTTNLNGTGIYLAHAEAQVATNPPTWQVNPAVVGLAPDRFTFISSLGSTNSFPNSLGAESGHADSVGALLYGVPGGLATNLGHVNNYEADYFYNSVIRPLAALNALVVNQSFVFGGQTVAQQQATDTSYDNFAARYNVVLVSGAGNGGTVSAPATCYNGIGVAAYGGSSSVGPTADNGRAKPDITAPAGATSFSTPLVAGAAALLAQAALRGDGGSDTNAAADARTIKALLLNGAVKPADWTRSGATPLDSRYGAGILNVYNAYCQMAGGKHGCQTTTTMSVGAAHPPSEMAGAVGVLQGWDFATNSSTVTQDSVTHYLVDVTNQNQSASFLATITLVWKRQQNRSAINDLDLFLYRVDTGNLVAASTSAVDNVEHIFVPNLPAGRYDLQVLKNGGTAKRITASETYALGFDFCAPALLSVGKTGANPVLRWPLYPAGYSLESASALGAAVWEPFPAVPTLIAPYQQLELAATNDGQFYRLRRP